MTQPKKSHWASLAAALGAAPTENLTEEPSSEAPAEEEIQEIAEPAAEVIEVAETTETVEISEIVAEAPAEPEVVEEPAAVAPPTKRHWAGLAQSLGLPVERLFGKAEPVAQAPVKQAPVAEAPKKAEPKPEPPEVEKAFVEKPAPTRAESTARSLFEERSETPESEKRAASLFIQIDSSSKKSTEPAVEQPRNLIPGDEIFFDTGDYDLIEDMKDEPESSYDDDDLDDEPIVRKERTESSEDATEESGAPRRRRRRRRGRRRDSRSESTSGDEEANEDEAAEISAELEPSAKEENASEEEGESSGAPRRRRRRRRSRKADEGEARKPDEAAPKRELTDVDFPGDEDASLDDDDDDDDHDMRRHRNIPSWLDAVTSIVDMNIERHKTAPQHVERRSGGGGGRRRRGGGRRPAAN